MVILRFFYPDLRQQSRGGLRDVGDGRIERNLIRFRGRAVATYLAHELKRRRRDFIRRCGCLRSAKDFDAPAHSRDYYALVAEFLHQPASPSGWGVVLTHGAGGNCTAPLLVAVAEALSAAGAVVLRYDLPFRRKRAFGPPSPATAEADRAGIRDAALRMRALATGPVILAGHSYGGRQSSMLAAEEPGLGAALLLLSYPLHPPGKPAQLRTAHFPALRTPSLFVSGTKDDFGTVDEMTEALHLIPAATRLITIEGARHDLAKGRFDIPGQIVQPLFTLTSP
jgi:predicted alpha/beta-hydrolase family hydrolase